MTDDVRNVENSRDTTVDETDTDDGEIATEFDDGEAADFEFDEVIQDAAAEADDAKFVEFDEEDAQPERGRFRPRRIPLPRFLRDSRVIAGILVALVLLSGGVASWVYFKQYRPDQQTGADVKSAVVSAATDGTTALLSYAPETLDQDFDAAKSHLAGDFLSYYTQFTQQVIAPAAKERQLKTSAHVKGAAVAQLHPDAGVVLVFVDQTTTTKDAPQPTLAVSTVIVDMNRINGKWLITKFTPVS